MTPQLLAAMYGAWVRLLTRQGVPPGAAVEPFENLATRYSSPDRAYHNLDHIAEMMDVVERLAGGTDEPDAVRLAVWFHDAEYDTHRSDNELRSAVLACEILTLLGLSQRLVDRVAALVRATAHLTAAEIPADRDIAALLDADLAILGATPERYSRYARDIRLEYHWVPETDYRRGRAAVLQAFLARPRVFHHALTPDVAEERARSNLKGELESLRPGSK